MKTRFLAAATIAVLSIGSQAFAQQSATPAPNMSFFVTSSNPKGGNLGGLTGADAVCQSLARAAGSTKTWRAYLSTSTVDAKTRIGNGPWYNFKGERIAQNVADLHSANNKISADTALTEKGTKPTYLSGNPPAAPAGQQLQHDMMTGSKEDGTKDADTCKDWTVGDGSAKAMLGHADRLGRTAGVNSWNAVHASQGCGMEQLQPTGSTGLFYCFATN